LYKYGFPNEQKTVYIVDMCILCTLNSSVGDQDPYFLGLPDPDPYPDPAPSIIKQKYLRKTFKPPVLYDFSSLKNYVNVASKSNKQKNLLQDPIRIR
jgi:hypothetical protein